MSIQKLVLSLCLIIGFFSVESEAKRPNKRIQNNAPTNCVALTDSIQKLYDAGDPRYLTWDIPTKCDSTQKYTAFFYQGLGFYLLSAWKESLYFFTLAKEIGGLKDEEILFHLWNANKKLDQFQEMERATVELYARNPNSFFLREILEQWQLVKKPTQGWDFSFSSKISGNKYDTSNSLFSVFLLNNRLSAATGQKFGHHAFREIASITHKTNLEDGSLKGLQASIGVEYEFKGISGEINYGMGYEPPYTSGSALLVVGANESQGLVDSNWNFRQGRVVLGYNYTLKNGFNFGWKVNALELSKDWHTWGLSQTMSRFFSNGIIVIGVLDYQNHNTSFLYGTLPDTSSKLLPPDSLTTTQDGLQTFNFYISPYYSVGKNSFGIGATYYASRLHYNDPKEQFGLPKFEWDQSISGSGSYGYDFRKWLKLRFNATYEFDLLKKAPGSDKLNLQRNFTHPAWSTDAAISIYF